MIETYEVSPFFLFEGKVNTVVQNTFGITAINDKSVINLLKTWDKNQQKQFNKNELEIIDQSEIDDVLNFLEESNIICKKTNKKYPINKLSIVSDNKEVSNNLLNMLNDDVDKKITIHSIDFNEFINKKFIESDLVIVILTKYSKRMGKIIKDKAVDENFILLMGYCYASNYYIDNFYKRDWFEPCHVCNISNIETQLRIDNGEKMSYQNLIDILYNKNQDIVISVYLSSYQKNIIAIKYMELIKKFLGNGNITLLNPDEGNMFSMIDLNTNQVYKDTALHWELCDCYE